MIINHNITALNTHNKLSSASAAQGKSMEKLASGLRINKAGDDAAGLAISEKMRSQVRGLDQASRNAQDGISLIQTAEGALNETHDILQRMRELAVQSSNDTNTDVDRNELQKEVNQLAQEVTRISENTEFNTKNLMGENGFNGKIHIGANTNQDITLNINDMGAKALNVVGVKGADVTNGKLTVNNKTEDKYTITYTPAGDKDAAAVAETTAVVDKSTKTITVTLKQAAGDSTTAGALASNDELAKALTKTGVVDAKVTIASDSTAAATIPATDVTVTAGVKDATVGIDISTQTAASEAITTITSSIETVSAERSKLGATQNRLEHTINNLKTSSENLTAAESRIRDVDMAKEMMNQTKNSILAQAAQAMLAQSNQTPQGVLQLLR